MQPTRGSCGGRLLRRVSLLSLLAVAEPQLLPCPLEVTNRTISNSTQAVDLIDALLCSGGQFEVTWVGEVLLTRTIAVTDGTSLKVSGSPSGRNVIDGGAQNQLFNISVGSTLELHGLSLVNGASSSGGGAVGLSGSSSLGIADCSFEGNTATEGDGGAILVLESSTVTIEAETTFADNSASFGGALLLSEDSKINIAGNTNFTSNTASMSGGAIYAQIYSTVTIQEETAFEGNTATSDGSSGGAIFVHGNSTVTIEGENSFADNSAVANGGAVLVAEGSTVTIEAGTTFAGNNASFGGAVCVLENSTVTTETESVFAGNTATYGGAIFVSDGSSTTIGGEAAFVGNTAGENGGAIYAQIYSTVTIQEETAFEGNNVTAVVGYGGALYVVGSSALSIEGETTFAKNSATRKGGAIFMSTYTDATIEGKTTFTDNTAGSDGGAIDMEDRSSASFRGETTFVGNTATATGGAIYMWGSSATMGGKTTFASTTAKVYGGAVALLFDSTFTVTGVTTFTNNSALDRGAVYVGSSTCTIEGETTFADNRVEFLGGAIHAMLENGTVTVNGATTFANNSAEYGGAVYVRNLATFSVAGETTFAGNRAEVDGGAVCAVADVFGGSRVDIRNTTEWTGNQAGSDGGALSCQESTCVIDPVNASFSNNSAEGNGGAVFAFGSNITLEGSTISSNTAAGAGGGIYCSSSVVSLTGNVLTENEAVWGGGLAMFSSGSVWSEAEFNMSGPANTTDCVFERNKAIDGGGIYSAAGYDMIRGCQFQENFAAGSGGAYLHSGVAVALERCTFAGNKAGDEGLAVLSLGIAENISGVVFDSNTFYCGLGTYGYEMGVSGREDPENCRFAVVCSRCATSPCGETQPAVEVVNSTSIPTCQPMMTGANSTGSAGATLQTLELERGYYRTSATSQDVLECHRDEACVGGINPSQYCATGYQDAYCAVCEEGYGPGYQYSCSSCVDQGKRSIATVAVVLVLALMLVALAIADLVDVVDEQNNTASSWNKRVHSCRNRIVEAVPLTAVKIVLVAWQILTQFTTVVDVVYPDVYDEFLSVLNLVNFDLGLVPSVSCIINVNFYGRLLFATNAPLAALGALGLTYMVAKSRNRNSPAGLQAAKGKHLSVALFIMFIVYSSVSFTVFQTWVCETLDNGVEYLRADYSLTCTTRTHTAWKVYAGLMILVYPVGIPAAFAWWLVSNRRDLVKVSSGDSSGSDRLQPMRDLWAPYKPRRYYYEVVECARRIMLTGLGVFLFPGSAAQVALEVILAVVFIVISEVLSPFADPMDAWLYRAGTWVVFFSMYLALLLKVDASDEDSQSQEIFAKLLIAANAGLILAVVVQAVVSVRKGLGVSARDAPVAKQNCHRLSFAEANEGESDGDDKHEVAPAWDETATTARLQGNTTHAIA